MLPNEQLEKEWLVWEYVSQSWTEIGLNKSEFPTYAQKIQAHYPTWQEVQPIINDVRQSFSNQIPLMFLFFPMIPDWGYEKTYLEQKIQQWHNVPRWRFWLNPLRWVGYPLTYLMTFGYIRRLKSYYKK